MSISPETPPPNPNVAADFASPTPFHTSAYLMAYRRHFGAGKVWHRLRVGAPKTQAAAYLMSRGRSARRLEWWGAGIHDLGGAVYNSPKSAQILWQEISSLAQSHDAAQLAQIPANSQLLPLAARDGWKISEAEACPVLSLPPTWDEYVKSLGKNMREQIRRYPKRLDKQFRTEYALVQNEDEVQSTLTDLFRLHGRRWRARGQTGVLATPQRQKFHREVCSKFLRRDWLRLWSLRCDGQAACVLLSYCHGGRYYFFIGGFEPELMRWSVGTCLFARVLRHAIEEDHAHEFDFLRGEEEYKYRFGAQNREYKTISRFQSTPRGRLLQQRIKMENNFMHRVHQAFSAAHR